MLKDMIIQVLPQILFLIITAIVGFFAAIAKQWWNAHKSMLELQRDQLIQKIGIDKYNQNIAIAQSVIHSVEEQARNFNWDSTIKHAKATELISNATSLTADQIFNIIKATVDEWNANKAKAVAGETPQVVNSTGQITNDIK